MSKEGGEKKSSNPLVSLAVGCISGGVEAIAVWPMEYMKTQLQLQNKSSLAKPLPYTGVFEGITYTVNTSGFFALYRGLGVTLVRWILALVVVWF
jgi:solute carrier family 25 (mitochondrial citrate transporter), member 1